MCDLRKSKEKSFVTFTWIDIDKIIWLQYNTRKGTHRLKCTPVVSRTHHQETKHDIIERIFDIAVDNMVLWCYYIIYVPYVHPLSFFSIKGIFEVDMTSRHWIREHKNKIEYRTKPIRSYLILFNSIRSNPNQTNPNQKIKKSKPNQTKINER